MKVTVNGEQLELDSSTLADLLERYKMHERRCATMVNGKVVRREERASTQLNDGDQVEIIAMVGGG